MKVGDLVRYKWTTFASRRRAKLQGTKVNAVGVVVKVFMGDWFVDSEYAQLLVQFIGEESPRRCTQNNLIVVK
jgi:hypothetical protein